MIIVLGLGFLSWAVSPLRSTASDFSVELVADGVYSFRAHFYANLFIVTSDGVIATDPINPTVARLYRRAIQEVTREPVRYVIYSHDHSDHIAGGAVFRDTARFVAHENAVARIRARHNPDIVPPDITFRDKYKLTLGDKVVELLYFGENHSTSNIGIFLATERILMLVDMVYPGSVPFRDLPGTDIRKYLETLPRIAELDFDKLVYGHGPPGTKDWVARYISYFDDLTAEVQRALEYQRVENPEKAGVGMDARRVLDIYLEQVTSRAVEALRPKYGWWGGYDDWATMNAKAVFFYLMMDA
jgi:glyoxylase-like metal-dependent hydrolase (beta-lactamase superfamily II)